MSPPKTFVVYAVVTEVEGALEVVEIRETRKLARQWVKQLPEPVRAQLGLRVRRATLKVFEK